jgi:tetratricopeptide (TPR) repeat protein
MKRFLLCIIFFISFHPIYSQNTGHPIPDFMQIESEISRSDSINDWYQQHVLYRNALYRNIFDSTKSLPILRSFLQYAEEVNDPIITSAANFYLGHYYSYLSHFYSNTKHLDSLGYLFMKKGLSIAEKKELKYLYAYELHDLGMAYYANNKRAEALEYLIRAHETFKEVGLKNIRKGMIQVSAFDLAFFYYHLGNYPACLDILLFLPEEKFKHNYINFQINNTIGLAYRELGKQDSAVYYFKKTMELAKSDKDTAWIGIAAGNIGTIYLRQNQYDKASPYCQLFYECAVKEQKRVTNTTIGEALIALAEISMFHYKIDTAIKQLTKAEKLLLSNNQPYYDPSTYKYLKKAYNILVKAYAIKKDFPQVMEYLEKEKSVDDSLSRDNIISQYTKVQVQLQAEKNLSQVKLVRNESKMAIQRRNFSLVALILLGLLLLTLYNRQRLKHRKDKEFLEAEKQRAEKHLATYVSNLHEKNKMIEDFQKEVERLESTPQSDTIQTIETLDKLLKATIITEEGWLQFKELFDKAHKGFFTRLKYKYPDLTEAEIRLLALTKLNMSTKEMGNMLGVLPNSIRKARYRLLKKLSELEGTNLDNIVNSL